MKHFNLITLLAISLFGLMACKKNSSNDPNLVTISGQVVKSCDDHSPVAGLELYLAGDKQPTFSSCKPKSISNITDKEGNFTISFYARDICMKEDAFLSLAIDTNNFKKTILVLPEYKILKNGLSSDVVVYYNNYRSYLVKLKLESDYSSSKDTIAYNKNNSNPLLMFNRLIPGPFVNGTVIDTLVYSGQHLDPSSGHFLDLFYIKKNGEEHFTKIRAKTLSDNICVDNDMQVLIP